MTNNNKTRLRQKAEKRLLSGQVHFDTVTETETNWEALVHELRVHQAELEIQNETLLDAQHKLDTSHRRYLDLFNNAPVGYVILDEKKKIVQVNATASTLLNTTPDMLTETFFYRLFVENEREKCLLYLNRLIQTDRMQSFESRVRTSKGVIVDIQLTCVSVVHETMTSYRVALLDITDKKRAEAQAYELEMSVEKKRISLLSDFITSASHDLRTPLASLTLGLNLLKRVLDNHVAVARVTKLQKTLKRLVAIVEKMFEMLSTDQPEAYTLKPKNIVDIVASAVEALQVVASEKAQRIQLSLPSETVTVMVDAVMITRAITNLLDNAIKYSPHGATIHLSLKTQDDVVVITIKDEGIGIPAHELPHIFERFYRIDKSRNEATGGSGLGLAIVKNIIEAHEGHIEVESEPDSGSVFRVFLPLI